MHGILSGRLPVAGVVVALLLAAGAQAGTFEMIVLPDTEDYADYYPSIFPAQTQWIVDNRVAENIAFVTHLGDMVHHALVDPGEWDIVTGAMYRLDGVVPYGASPGNHDLEDPAGFIARFGPSHFAGTGWYGGASPNNLNSCQVFSAGGYEFLHISLQKAPSSSTRAWAAGVIEANPGKPTILSTHDYLDVSGITSAGVSIWNDVVEDHPQVFMVINGHSRGVNRVVTENVAGKQVLQMLVNYQDEPTAGGETDSGYLRKIIFDPDNGRISFQTYSPTYAAQPWLTSDAHQFSYDVAFLPQTPGGTLGPIYLTDAATCGAAGGRQDFDTVPGPAGTSMPLGWTAWKIDGTAGTFSAARPIGPADIASASAAAAMLSVIETPPAGTFGSQVANVPGITGRALGTNPGDVAASVVQWKVTNGTGASADVVHLYYDLSLPWYGEDDDGRELPGYALFWSATGGSDPGNWALLGTDTSAGLKAWDVALPAAIEPGADLYLRWADDNALAGGEASPEDVWSLDNVRIVMTDTPDPSVRGDADGDGDVDADDFIALKRNLGSHSATWEQGDFDHDQDVDRDDLRLLAARFGRPGDLPLQLPPGNPVPEPATLFLLALGAAGLIRRKGEGTGGKPRRKSP